jgi:D-alanyl-D-alanine carboxypeptidase
MLVRRGLRRAATLTAALAAATTLAVGIAAAASSNAESAAASAGAPAGADAAASIARQLEQEHDGAAITDVTPPPTVSAKGWLVYDATVGEPIAAVDASTPRPIASLAKLMTAAVVLDRVDLDATITIPAAVNELDADASIMGAHPGEKWPAHDLLRAMLVYSANDAALALASHVTDGDIPAFVTLMNEQATELGLDDSEFASPTGLDLAGTVSTSTPVDLVALAEHVLADDAVRSAVAEDEITLKRPGGGGAPIKLANRNPLLGSYVGVDGV